MCNPNLTLKTLLPVLCDASFVRLLLNKISSLSTGSILSFVSFSCMNRFVALLLTCLYLTAFSGATVTVHYCMGKMASVSVDEPYNNKFCNKCVAKKKACCQDKQTVLKVEGKHELVVQKISVQNLDCLATKAVAGRKQILRFCSAVSLPGINSANSPPVPFRILQCIYRI